MSASHQRVVWYLLENLREASFLSAAELGQRVAVSDATVVRLAPMLGYSGYPELRSELQTNLIEAATPRTLQKQRSTAHIDLHEVIDLEIGNLTMLKETLTDEVLNEAVTLVRSARHVFVIGIRSLFGVANACAHLLRQIRPDVTMLTLMGESVSDDLMTMSKGDVLIAISTARYSRHTIKIAEFARGVGCDVVAITDSAVSPIAQLASSVLVVTTRCSSFFASAVAIQAVVNVLVAVLAQRNGFKAENHLARTDEVLDALEVMANRGSGGDGTN